MPSVYDFRHVELDKVGRGKKIVQRVIKAPGGGSSNIFGPEGGKQQSNGNGSCSETESVDGSVLSCPSTPVHNGNGNGSAFGYESDTSSTPSSAASSRRGSLAETKNRVFGLAEAAPTESPRRRVVDRMKSNIFAEPEPAPIVRTPSVKKYEHVVNRNPITGEVLDKAVAPPANGTANGNGTVNGVNGSASMPNTPVRVRQPPGGKSSNIFG
ncbi:hypothetical protein TYRP_000423 [Tyrophagus putrescentiae]|nr:hypothetical protein TYRP_000423 [Tyrophagus putrescentiae]